MLSEHQVRILDLNLWEFTESLEILKQRIQDFGPQVVGLSIRNIDTTLRTDVFYHFKTVRPTAQLVKHTDTSIKMVVGGAGFSLFAQKIMERVPEFDFGVYLEAETSFPELLDRLDSAEDVKGIYVRRDGHVQFTGTREPPDFGSLPMPIREGDVVDIKDYKGTTRSNTGIQTKRGCVLNCAYCSYTFLSGQGLRLRSAQSVVDEVEYLTSLGIREFSFLDNVFNVPLSHAQDICKEMIRRELDVEWNAWFEIKHTTEDLLRLARDAGCRHFRFSPDAATDKLLAVLEKDITKKDIVDNVHMVRRVKGFVARYSFFLAIPGMTLLDVVKTLIMFVRIHVLLLGRGTASFNWVRIEPHTKLYDIALEEGFLEKDVDLLPANEQALAKLFYTKRRYWLIDYCAIKLLWILEHVAKPIVKLILRVLGKERQRDSRSS